MKVSVVIASYNHEQYVARALESVLGQSFQDFEIVLTDDASTDRTFEIAQGFDDARIHCVKSPRNRGTSATYNACIARARGDYIAVLNSDDLFVPEKLARQVQILDQMPSVGAVFTEALLIDESERPHHGLPGGAAGFKAPNRTRQAWLRNFFENGNSLCHPSVMIRRAVHAQVGVYDPRLIQVHDFDMWIRLCMRHEIHVIAEPLTFFRVRDNEANANNTRPGTVARIDWEYEHVMQRFLDIQNFADFVSVFPEAAGSAADWGSETQRYYLAKLAMGGARPAQRRFAMELLHDLYGELGAEEMERRFGLPPDWYWRMTGDPELIYGRPPSTTKS